MTRNIAGPLATTLVITVLLLAGTLPQPARAVSPPTFDCEVDFAPSNVSGGYSDINSGDHWLAGEVARSGNLILSQSKNRFGGGGLDNNIVAINTQCSPLWNSPCVATSTSSCIKQGLSTDPAGQATAIALTYNNAGSPVTNNVQHFNTATGNILPQAVASPSILGFSCATPNGEWTLPATSGYYSSTADAIRYATIQGCGTTQTALAITDDTTVISHVVLTGSVAGFDINVPGESSIFAFVTGSGSGTSLATYKIDLVAGTILNTLSLPCRCEIGTAKAPQLSNTHPGSVYVLTGTGDGNYATTSYGWNRITIGTWASAETGAFGAGGNANMPNGLQPDAWALGGDDSMLACGTPQTSPFNVIRMQKANTDTAHLIDWNVATTPGSATGLVGCSGIEYDHGTGFYVYGTYNVPTGAAAGHSASFIQHWTGGGITQPTPTVDHTVLYSTTSTSTGGVTNATFLSASNAILAFAQTIVGPGAGDLFLFGFLLVVIVMVILFAVCAAFLKAKNGNISGGGATIAGVVGLSGGLCMMVFNVFALIWQVWAAAILIILCAGLITVAVTKVFARGSGGAS